MNAAVIVLIVAVVLIIAAMAAYLLPVIVGLMRVNRGLDQAIASVGEIIEKTTPVNPIVEGINTDLDTAVGALEGLLVKKAGLTDAMGLIEGLYPGAAAQGLRDYPDSGSVKAPRIGEVYTRGVLTLARLGREAPIAAASPDGPALRNPSYGAHAALALYPEGRQARPPKLPRSPVIGTDAPVQYPERSLDADASPV
jgi:hypothetical protein